MPEVRIYFYGNDQPVELPIEFSHLGLLPVEKCNELYNRCSVGLCFSSTNPSRIPFEMMAAGLPVVDIWGDNTLYDLPDGGVRLAEPTPESVAWTILDLLRKPDLRAQMSAAGRAFMKERELEFAFKQFVSFVDELFAARSNGARKHTRFERTYSLPAMQAPEPTASQLRAHLFTPAPLVEGEEPVAVQPSEAAAEPPHAVAPYAAPLVAERPHHRSLSRRIVHRLQHTLRVFLTGA